jgi:hypothetical protein
VTSGHTYAAARFASRSVMVSFIGYLNIIQIFIVA